MGAQVAGCTTPPVSSACPLGSRSAHHTPSMPGVSLLPGSGKPGEGPWGPGYPLPSLPSPGGPVPPLQPPPPPARSDSAQLLLTLSTCWWLLFFFFLFLFRSMTSLLCFGRVIASAQE